MPAIEGLCREVVALPGRTPQDLSVLQGADPVIGPLRKYYREGRRPSAAEREVLPQGSRVLLRQWDRLINEEGVLYRVINTPGGGCCCPTACKQKSYVVSTTSKDTKAQNEHSSYSEADVFGLVWLKMLNSGVRGASDACWGRPFNLKSVRIGAQCKPLDQMKFWPLTSLCWSRPAMDERMS